MLVLYILYILVYRLLISWIVMLMLGAAHSFDDRVPAFGFHTLVWLTWAIAFATAHGSSTTTSTVRRRSTRYTA